MKTTITFIMFSLLTLSTRSTLAEENAFVVAFDDARVNVSASLDGTAAYMQIINYSKSEPITLTHVSSELVGNVRLQHADKPVQSLQAGNATALTIQPGSGEVLSAEGYYLYLEGLTAPITEGQRIPLLMTFEHGDSYVVDAIAVKAGTHLHGDEDEGYSAHNDH